MPGPSSEYLRQLAQQTRYRPDTLEKVVRLIDILREVQRHPLLSRVLVLKGGTALNLGFGQPQRLSVDLDFNYIGALDREEMLRERPEVEEAVRRIASAQGYKIQQSSPGHAGVKLFLTYRQAGGGPDRIEVDVNFLHRLPFLDPVERVLWSPEGEDSSTVRMLAPEELYAGKACAMLDRMAPRDLYDMADLHDRAPELIGSQLFRSIFMAYSGALPHPVYTYESNRRQGVNARDVRNQLYPMLVEGDSPDPVSLFEKAWHIMTPLLELSEMERAFVDRLQIGELHPEWLFPDDLTLADRVRQNPMLLWKAQNAAAHAKRRREN